MQPERSHATDTTTRDAGSDGAAPPSAPRTILGRGRLLLAAALVFVLGWLGSIAWSSTASLQLVDRFTGTVSIVNVTGAGVCLEADGGGQRCGVPYQPRDAPILSLGDRVTIAVGLLRQGDGSAIEIYVVEAVE